MENGKWKIRRHSPLISNCLQPPPPSHLHSPQSPQSPIPPSPIRILESPQNFQSSIAIFAPSLHLRSFIFPFSIFHFPSPPPPLYGQVRTFRRSSRMAGSSTTLQPGSRFAR